MKIVLAYSGGLDTSVALRWLQQKYEADVIAYCVNLGQLDDLRVVERRARAIGAAEVVIDDKRGTYLREFAFPALRASARYEGRYLMAAPLGRPLIARGLVETAHRFGCEAVAHGSTGKGNDQVRFYTGVVAHDPTLRVLAPCMEWELGSRQEELQFAEAHGIEVDASPRAPYSKDGSLWGSSTECGMLDDPNQAPTPDVFQMTADPHTAPSEGQHISVGFRRGLPISVNGRELEPIELVLTLNELAGRHGIGRVDIVEDSLLGYKSRAIYESPGATLLHFAHRELESLCVERDALRFKQRVADRYAELVYEGKWFSPLREALDGFVDVTQRSVNGEVEMLVRGGHIKVVGRRSTTSLLRPELVTHDGTDEFEHGLAEGFSYVWSMPERIRAKNRRGV